MKRAITFITVLLSTQFSFASHCETSTLNLRLSDQSVFKVSLDGKLISNAGNIQSLNNISKGQHFLQVYKVSYAWGGYETLDNAFRGYVSVTGNTESFATIFPDCGEIKFDRVINLNQCTEPIYPYSPFKKNPGYFHHKNPHPVKQSFMCNDVPGQAAYVPAAMGANNFSQLKVSVGSASFESTKLSIFKQALGNNYFTTVQVCELLDLFWFEGTKLEIAKLSYPKTMDPYNYYMINNKFTFSGSVNELGDYVVTKY